MNNSNNKVNNIFQNIHDSLNDNSIKQFNKNDLRTVELPFDFVTSNIDNEPTISLLSTHTTSNNNDNNNDDNEIKHSNHLSTVYALNDDNSYPKFNCREFADNMIPKPKCPSITDDNDLRKLYVAEALDMYSGVSDNDIYIPISNPSTKIQLNLDIDCNVESFKEIIDTEAESTAHNSSSLLRRPATGVEYARGSYSNTAFRPGGLEVKDNDTNNKIIDIQERFPWLYDKESTAIQTKLPISTESNRLENNAAANNKQEIYINDVEQVQLGYNNRGTWLKEIFKDMNLNYDHEEKNVKTEVESKNIMKENNSISLPENTELNIEQLRFDKIFDQFDDDLLMTDIQSEIVTNSNGNEQDDNNHDRTKLNSITTTKDELVNNNEIDILLDTSNEPNDVLPIKSSSNKMQKKSEWAVMKSINTSNFHQQIPNPPIWYPFELDDFQKQAILHLEKGESVFVSAHTSSGKTVVAEYAIALCAKHLTRAIYTSPIKTLSNQKFREFRNTFGENEVGIMTGDVSINVEAPCLILTTEILRSMLYRGADLIRDIEWVIFDEVHYINDLERGVVWEEVIIMLPEHVKIIMLSATVPNTYDFADWVGRTKQQQIHVISTHKRPVPLHHYLWNEGKMFNILDTTGVFHVDAFKRARDIGKSDVKPNQRGRNNSKNTKFTTKNPNKHARQKWGGAKAKHNPGHSQKGEWLKLIKFLQKQELLPLVVFSFSKRQCDESAFSIHSLDLNSSEERSEVNLFLHVSLKRLSENDSNLPQVNRIKELVLNGIGVHHAGMLPILKEIVEMLFAKGLVKVLFATETFAMGVNMPARTVVFNGIRKHDGREFRNLLPGEYTQMSGRAGRRGLDSFGVVAINCRHGEVPESWEIKTMLTGQATQLQSQFRLTYSMILNLLRQEDMKVSDMIQRSFLEVNTKRDAPTYERQLTKDMTALENMDDIDCIHGDSKLIENFFDLYNKAASINLKVAKELIKSGKWDTLLCNGRIIYVNKYNLIHCLGIVLRGNTSNNISDNNTIINKHKSVLALVLCPSTWKPLPAYESIKEHTFSGSSTYVILEVGPIDVQGITETTLKEEVQLFNQDNRELLIKKLEHFDNYKEELNIINPSNEINLSVDTATEWMKKHEYDMEISNSLCHSCPRLADHYEILQRRHVLKQRIKNTKSLLSSDNTFLTNDFQSKLRVLQHLQYVDHDDTVLLKGRVACEINTCNALVVTEMIFENIFTDLTAGEIASLLSCLIFKEKNADTPSLTPRLQDAQQSLNLTVERLNALQIEYDVDFNTNDFIKENTNIGLMQVVYEWTKGTVFNEICALTNVLEGSIVRNIQRLNETCRDVRNAARVIGDPVLYQKMELATSLMKRDIVFAASLYVA